MTTTSPETDCFLMPPLLYCVVTLNEFFQIPLSAILSGAHYCGIDYVYEVTTGAEGGTRTPTGLLPPAPQADASTIPPLPQSVPHSNVQVGKRGEALLARFLWLRWDSNPHPLTGIGF